MDRTTKEQSPEAMPYMKTTYRKPQLNSSTWAARTHMIKGKAAPGFITLALRLYKLVLDPYP